MTKIVKNWSDFVGLESDTYKLKIDLDIGNGWIIPKESFPNKPTYYLSTHVFYDKSYKGYEQLLRKCGFDIEIQTCS